MPKTCRSAVTKKCHKLADSQLRKNEKTPQVCRYRNMPYKLPGLPSRIKKNMHRSAFLWKCKKLAGSPSRRMLKKTRRSVVTENAKSCRSAVTENAKNSQVCGHGKMRKTLRSAVMENAKNSQVRCEGKMPETHRFAVIEKCQKLAGPQSRENAKNPQVCDHKKCK